MTDKPDRDGILDPRASEPVAKPPEIEAFDRWAAEPDNLAAWEAARRRLAHAAGDVDEALDVARTALLLASDGPERERERARREILDLLADRRPLAASAHFRPGREHHRPAAAPHPESRRDVRRGPGRGRGLPQVGGVGAWADAARGVLTLTGQGDNRTLAIAKANWGRAFVLTQLAPVSNDAGALIGFDGPDGWTSPKEESYDSAA